MVFFLIHLPFRLDGPQGLREIHSLSVLNALDFTRFYGFQSGSQSIVPIIRAVRFLVLGRSDYAELHHCEAPQPLIRRVSSIWKQSNDLLTRSLLKVLTSEASLV